MSERKIALHYELFHGENEIIKSIFHIMLSVGQKNNYYEIVPTDWKHSKYEFYILRTYYFGENEYLWSNGTICVTCSSCHGD